MSREFSRKNMEYLFSIFGLDMVGDTKIKVLGNIEPDFYITSYASDKNELQIQRILTADGGRELEEVLHRNKNGISSICVFELKENRNALDLKLNMYVDISKVSISGLFTKGVIKEKKGMHLQK